MGLNVAQKLLRAHLVDGELRAGSETALTIDQALIQDATGTLVMLALEASVWNFRAPSPPLRYCWRAIVSHQLGGIRYGMLAALHLTSFATFRPQRARGRQRGEP